MQTCAILSLYYILPFCSYRLLFFVGHWVLDVYLFSSFVFHLTTFWIPWTLNFVHWFNRLKLQGCLDFIRLYRLILYSLIGVDIRQNSFSSNYLTLMKCFLLFLTKFSMNLHYVCVYYVWIALTISSKQPNTLSRTLSQIF